ncbi:HSF family protein [Abortiporus biennis]
MSAEQQLAVANRGTRGESSHLSKAARQVVPPFLQKLYEIVNDPANDELIRWSENGDSFYVLNHEKFAREVLGRWFKHQKFTSFVRQLNMYGFHKIPHLQQGVLKSDTDTEPWHFEHPHFRRSQPDLLCLIQRKKQPPHGTVEEIHMDFNEPPPANAAPPLANLTAGQVLDINSVVNGIAAIKRHQQAISADLNELKTSNQHLWQEALAARVFGHNAEQVHKHDGAPSSPPRVVIPRKRQRLMIGNGGMSEKGKSVAADSSDDEHRGSFESVYADSPASTGPFSNIETSEATINSPSVAPSEAFSPTPTDISSTPYVSNVQPVRPTEVISRSSTVEPTKPSSSTSQSTTDAPTPAESINGNGNHLTSSAAPNSSTSLVSNFPQGTTPEMWSIALQQMLGQPNQLQRLMQAFAAQQNHPQTSPADPTISMPPSSSSISPSMFPPPQAPTPAHQQVAPYDPNIYDISRFRTNLPSNIQSNPTAAAAAIQPLMNTGLLHSTADEETPALEHLAENADRLHKTYRDAEEINAEVDLLHQSLNSLIHTLGIDPGAITATTADGSSVPPPNGTVPTAAPHMQPPLHNRMPNELSSIGLDSLQPQSDPMNVDGSSSDFDFDAFLNDLTTHNDRMGDYADLTAAGFNPSGSHINGIRVGDTSTEQFSSLFDGVPGVTDSNSLDQQHLAEPVEIQPSIPTTARSGGGRKRKSEVIELPGQLVQDGAESNPTQSPKTKKKR